jgi:CheY-like chemotaxis protein
MGIAADQQDSLFQPFHRAGQENGPIEGTGIGLAITKRLAELMGGRVGFVSRAGLGSSFWVEVPAHSTGVASSAPATLQPGATEERPVYGSKLVLYVEDNPANVAFMQELMATFEGIELVVARTAEEGIEIAGARRPALVILDINLPGMSGYEALAILRARSETSRIPVVALTAGATEHDRRRGEAAGFYRYLTKPLRISELEAVLETLLSVRMA